MEKCCDRIKIAMELKGLKQADLVRITGINKGAMSCYVNGRYEPKYETLDLIAQALDISVLWLLGKIDKIIPYAKISNDDLKFLESISISSHDNQPLSEDDEKLNKFLNTLGYNIEKLDDKYSFLYDKGIITLSQDDYNELICGLKEAIRIEAANAVYKYLKDYIMKFLQKAFSTNSSP